MNRSYIERYISNDGPKAPKPEGLEDSEPRDPKAETPNWVGIMAMTIKMKSKALLILILFLTGLGSILFGLADAEAAIAFRNAAQAIANAPVSAAPTFQAAGTVQAGTGALTGATAVAWPAHQANDIGLLIIETENQAVTLGTNAVNWTPVANSPQGTGTAGGPGATRLTVFWSRATSGAMGAVGVNDSGDHQRAQIITFRGVITTGNPWDVTAGNVASTTATAVSIPGATTTVANTLVVAIVANSTDTTTVQTSGWANASLTGLTERADGNTTAGNGGGFGVATGVMATAGAYNATTATLLTSSVQGRMSIALRPPAPTLTINLPTNTQQNDVMIASIGFRTNQPGLSSDIMITPPAGWTLVRRLDNTGGGATDSGLVVYQKVAGASEPTNYTWTLLCTLTCSTYGFQAAVGGIASFSGVDTATPIEVEDGQFTTLSRDQFTPSVTTTVANTMLVTSHSLPNNNLWQNPPPSGLTQAFQLRTPSEMIQVSYALQATAGATGQKQATDSGGDAIDIGNAHILALRPQCAVISEAAYAAANAQSAQAIIYWSSSIPALILRKSGSSITDAPSNGTAYSAGNTIGSSSVVYSGSVVETSFTQGSLTNGTTYYYKVFAKNGTCYSSSGIEVNARPEAGSTPAWSYMMSNGSTMRAGIAGEGSLNSSGNFGRIISLNTTDGTQMWTPVATNGAVQSWLSWLPVGGYQYREQVTVTASTAAVPSGYSVSVTFNHASLVTAGKSLASGDDVRVFYWGGSSWLELDRVLDSGSSWNNAATRIWFKTQAAIGASASDANYYLYYGNPGAGSPPANKANIFLFADDFETGNLSKWSILSGSWQVATDQIHGGTYALKYPTEGPLNRLILANPSLNEANVYLDAWWRFSVLDPANSIPDLAQMVRADATGANDYEVNIEDQCGCREQWDIAELNAGNFNMLSPDTLSTAAANTWTRIGVAIYGTGMRVFKDGTQINPASGSYNVGTRLASGNIGFRKWETGAGAWWIDDIVARRYVDPEPSTALAAEEPVSASATLINGDQSGRVYSVSASTGATNWTVNLTGSGAETVQAPVAAQLLVWSDATFQSTYSGDVLFVATRNSSATNNKVFALRASDGQVFWTFNGSGTYNVDYIVGMPWVDYARNRVYVVSRAGAAGTQSSLWVINSLNGNLVQSFALGHIEASPTMSYDGNTLYVGATNGDFYAYNLNTLTQKWWTPLSDGVKGFVWEDWNTPGRLYLSTMGGQVRSLQDNGGSVSPVWTTAVAGASTPLPTGTVLYVGSSDGKVHQLRLSDGLDEKQFTVGTGAFAVGDVSTETLNEIFVPTTEGKLYKLPLPLP